MSTFAPRGGFPQRPAQRPTVKSWKGQSATPQNPTQPPGPNSPVARVNSQPFDAFAPPGGWGPGATPFLEQSGAPPSLGYGSGPNASQVWDDAWWAQSGKDTSGNPYADTSGMGGMQTDPSLMPAFQNEMNRLNSGQGLTRWQGIPGTPGYQAPGGGSGGAIGGTNGLGQIQTSINPQGVFGSQFTNSLRNQAVADWHQKGNLNQNLKLFDRAGISRSGRNTYKALPLVTNAYQGAAKAGASIPLGHEIANQQNKLRGQIGQGNEYASLAQLLLGQMGLGNYQNQQNIQSLVPLLNSLLGGL